MAAPSRLAAALDYLERLKSQADQYGNQTQMQTANVGKEFLSGVGQNLAERAKGLGQIGYEAFSQPTQPYATTAEISAQPRNTPIIDETMMALGRAGKALATDPIGAGKAMVMGEVERAKGATQSPMAAGEYAGSFVDPMRLVRALKAMPNVMELDVWHGTPHRFKPTPENPLGEFDASKIGTGEGAQAYGQGTYLAEAPDVAEGYRVSLAYDPEKMTVGGKQINKVYDAIQNAAARLPPNKAAGEYEKLELLEKLMMNHQLDDVASSAAQMSPSTIQWFEKQVKPSFQTYGSLYKADLPDEMIDRMLDWDKPINEQSPQVLAMLEKAGINTMSTAQAGPMARGQEAHLAKFGIPGIKYLDEGSRNTAGKWIAKHPQGGENAFNSEKEMRDFIKRNPEMTAVEPKQTRNFVVFPGEEKKVKILERK